MGTLSCASGTKDAPAVAVAVAMAVAAAGGERRRRRHRSAVGGIIIRPAAAGGRWDHSAAAVGGIIWARYIDARAWWCFQSRVS